MDDSLRVRTATPDDAEACRAVYAPYVLGTAISFEEHPPEVAEVRERIVASLARHTWLVAEDAEGHVVGYAYGGPFRTRPAYRWSCETSVYLEQGRRRTGAGRLLYAELLARLTTLGFRTALAAMTVPNPASLGLHTAVGFTEVGTFHRVGFKQGAWHDVLWMQRPLGDEDDSAHGSPTDL